MVWVDPSKLALLATACGLLCACGGRQSDTTPGAAGGTGGVAGAAPVAGAGGAAGAAGAPQELEVRPLMYTPVDLPLQLVAQGHPMELWRAPQGGHVLLVGARVRGLDSDTINLRARVRDAETGAIVAEEARTVGMEEVEGEPGWLQTGRRTRDEVSHVPVCPNYDSRPIVNTRYVLEVLVTELYADFSEGTARFEIVPSCMQDDDFTREHCECECGADYILGESCAWGETG